MERKINLEIKTSDYSIFLSELFLITIIIMACGCGLSPAIVLVKTILSISEYEILGILGFLFQIFYISILISYFELWFNSLPPTNNSGSIERIRRSFISAFTLNSNGWSWLAAIIIQTMLIYLIFQPEATEQRSKIVGIILFILSASFNTISLSVFIGSQTHK